MQFSNIHLAFSDRLHLDANCITHAMWAHSLMCSNFYNAGPAAKHIHEEQSPAKVLYDLNQCCGSKYMVFGSGSWNLTQFASRSKPFHTVTITSHFEKNVKKIYLEFIIWKAFFKELIENREILSVRTIFNCVDSNSEYGSRFVLGKRILFEFFRFKLTSPYKEDLQHTVFARQVKFTCLQYSNYQFQKSLDPNLHWEEYAGFRSTSLLL